MLSCLERQLRAFVQLPFRSLDRLSLSARLAELASGTDAKVEPAASERPDMTSTAREPGPIAAAGVSQAANASTGRAKLVGSDENSQTIGSPGADADREQAEEHG
jgi:hypothetical protein